MKFGIFYEHQLPRPWEDGSELKLFQDALTQVELADRLGYVPLVTLTWTYDTVHGRVAAIHVAVPAAAQRIQAVLAAALPEATRALPLR